MKPVKIASEVHEAWGIGVGEPMEVDPLGLGRWTFGGGAGEPWGVELPVVLVNPNSKPMKWCTTWNNIFNKILIQTETPLGLFGPDSTQVREAETSPTPPPSLN